MWVAVLLAGWLLTSFLLGPWIGRFVSTHVRIREVASNAMAAEHEPPKPAGLARRA